MQRSYLFAAGHDVRIDALRTELAAADLDAVAPLATGLRLVP